MSDEVRKPSAAPLAASAVDEQKAIGYNQSAHATQSEKEQAKAATDFGKSAVKSKSTMHVRVYSPFRYYYDDQAFSISAVNATGPFDILPQHHNFISLLSSCELVVRAIGEENRKIRISGGIMHVKADQVIVFLDV